MKSRVDVWPALTDLFSGLLVATFGGLMLFTGTDPVDEVVREAREIKKGVAGKLQAALGGNTREIGDDVYVDVTLNFQLNEDAIQERDRVKVARACSALSDLFRQNPEWVSRVEIWIEGHTDSTRPGAGRTRRDRDLYNWRLSGNRAASVLYEFAQCGLAPPEHRIRAMGYADTNPLPQFKDKIDSPENRRTTFYIHPDKCRIAKELNKLPYAGCPEEDINPKGKRTIPNGRETR